MKRLLFAVAALVFASAPALAQEASDLSNAGGAEQTAPPAEPVHPDGYPVDYEALVRHHFEYTLVDPESVRYREIAAPIPVDWGRRGHPNPAWLVCVTYNARNRMGGYVGFSTSAIIIQNGRIIDTRDNEGRPGPVTRLSGTILCPG